MILIQALEAIRGVFGEDYPLNDGIGDLPVGTIIDILGQRHLANPNGASALLEHVHCSYDPVTGKPSIRRYLPTALLCTGKPMYVGSTSILLFQHEKDDDCAPGSSEPEDNLDNDRTP